MANSVNDVMNVIASPDYGIKNIAGTNKEILAILQGTHNSENNIYNIVDDVRNLLQKLVDANPKKKTVEVSGNNSTKINHRHIKDILDETKGIRKAIDNLSKSMGKQWKTMPTVAKLSEKASEKVAQAMVKSMNKQNIGSGFSSIIDAFNKLKNISLTDIIEGKIKLNRITKIFKKSKENLNIEDKEINNIIKIINFAPEMVKSLSRINWRINKIIKNNIIKKLSDILVGKNSILSLSTLLNKHKKEFNNAKKSAKYIKELVDGLFTSTILLTTIAVTGIPALLGVKFLEKIINNISPAIKKLYDDNKYTKKAAKAAINISAISGLIAISSTFLATIAVTGIPALLGVKFLEKIINNISPAIKKLSQSNRYTKKATQTAVSLTAFTGFMAVSSAFLATIAVTGIPALLGVKFLEKIINNISPAIKKLYDDNKYTKKATQTAVSLTTVSGLMAISSVFLATIAVTGIPSLLGVKFLEKIINNISPVIKKLSDDNKYTKKATQTAVSLTAFTGLMTISSVFLATIAVTGIPALLGVKFLEKIINNISPVIKKLSQSNRYTKKATQTAASLTTISGLMAVSSAFLATIAVTGIPALLGSVLMIGIVKINILTFKMLSKAKKNILKGSIALAIMSSSLLLFGISLKKIVDATKGVNFKQIGVIATLTTLLSGTIGVMGIPIITGAIILGSIAMGIMGLSLIPFAKSLSIIAKATENLKLKHVFLVNKSIDILSIGVAKMALLAIPVSIGAKTLKKMSTSLIEFAKSLKTLISVGSVPSKQVYQVLKAMKSIGEFFKENKLKKRAIKTARRYNRMLKPFSIALKHLAKLKELGTVPMKLVYNTLKAMKTIADYYIDNPIRKKAIRQAKRYVDMLKPFGKTIKQFTKLKELGVLPTKLVYQTLKAMKTIADYYIDNPIRKKAIRQAKRYTDMLKPFGNTIKQFTKLKELGVLPTKLVYQTLKAMKTIADYYIDNPIRKKAIRQAERYKDMLKPFGNTIKQFVKLKELGVIPMKLVHQTMKAMTSIANYYIDNPINKKVIKQAKRYSRVLKPFGNTIKQFAKLKELGSIPMKLVHQTLNAISAISDFYKEQDLNFERIDTANNAITISEIISSFGKSVGSLKPLKDLRDVPINAINNIIEAANNISIFYNTTILNDNVNTKSALTEYIVDKFANMSIKIQEKLANIKAIDSNIISSFTNAFSSIFDYYRKNKFSIRKKKILRMNEAVKLFAENANSLKENLQGFTKNEYISVKFAVKSMKRIIKLFDSKIKINRAQENMIILKDMTSAMSNLSNINSTNITSIGDVISNTLNGVSTVDMGKVEAVTNMFNAFNGINKSESIINKFTESVKEFTNTCKSLMDAMSNNTDAINNIDTNNIGGSFVSEIHENSIIEREQNDATNQTNGIRIANVEEIAKTIAEKINGALSVDVSDTQVQLLINGMGGNEWTITRY